MQQFLKYGGCVIVGLLIGALAAWFLLPRETRIEHVDKMRVETVYVDKVRTETVVQYKDRVVTKTRTITKPDGTIIREDSKATTQSGSAAKADDRLTAKAETSERVRTETIVSPPPVWTVNAFVLAYPADIVNPTGGVMVTRRLVGPLSVGIMLAVPLRQPIAVPNIGATVALSF